MASPPLQKLGFASMLRGSQDLHSDTLKIFDELITTVRNDDVGNPDGDDCLCFLSPEDAANIKTVQTAHRNPMSPIAPFYDWSINDIYQFWLAHVRPPMDMTFGGWTSFNFIVLDANSAKDRKYILCCNAPDIGEKGDEVVLKGVRMAFAQAAVNMASFEMMTIAPSESNKDKALNVVPPVWIDTTDTPPGEMKSKIATPEYATAANRRAFLQAEARSAV